MYIVYIYIYIYMYIILCIYIYIYIYIYIFRTEPVSSAQEPVWDFRGEVDVQFKLEYAILDYTVLSTNMI